MSRLTAAFGLGKNSPEGDGVGDRENAEEGVVVPAPRNLISLKCKGVEGKEKGVPCDLLKGARRHLRDPRKLAIQHAQL